MKKPAVPKSNDIHIRICTVSNLITEGIPRSDIRHELTLDTASSGGRADIVVLRDDALWGIELKSGKDVLDRCKEQMENYGRAFDRRLIIADKRHSGKYAGQYSWLFHCHETGRLVSDYGAGWKDAAISPNIAPEFLRCWSTSPLDMASLLWKDEISSVCQRLRIFQRDTIRHECMRAVREMGCLKDLRPLIIAQLRKRVLSKWEQSFWAKFDAQATA